MKISVFGRLLTELTGLDMEIGKLKEFIIGDKYDKLPKEDRELLKEQLGYMESYLHILKIRVSRMCNNT